MAHACSEVSIAIVFDSGSRGDPALNGRTRTVAECFANGADSVAGAAAALIPVAERDRHWDVLDAADAIVFGCPTYMGSVSAALKAFMEETIWPQFIERRWQNKLAAGFTNSAGMSGDKLIMLQQLAVFAAQHGMVWVSLGVAPGWQTSAGSADDPNRLAAFLGLMTQSNADQGPDVVPPASDRATAEQFGRRLATLTHQWVYGRSAAAPERAATTT
jgi:multimeric flavodoxin WrbA